MAKARRLSTHFMVCYSVRGEKLGPKRCNPLLERFSRMLKDFKIEKEDIKTYVEIVDNFSHEEIDSRWIKCSSHLRIEVIDTSPSLDPHLYSINDHYKALFHNGLRKLFLVDGKYSKRVDIKVEDTFEGSSPPMSRENSAWPRQKF